MTYKWTQLYRIYRIFTR